MRWRRAVLRLGARTVIGWRRRIRWVWRRITRLRRRLLIGRLRRRIARLWWLRRRRVGWQRTWRWGLRVGNSARPGQQDSGSSGNALVHLMRVAGPGHGANAGSCKNTKRCSVMDADADSACNRAWQTSMVAVGPLRAGTNKDSNSTTANSSSTRSSMRRGSSSRAFRVVMPRKCTAVAPSTISGRSRDS